jgi:hypothetical protein
MPDRVSAVVKYADTSVSLRFAACRVMAGGEFAGNIELDVDCDASHVDIVMQCLRVQVPDAAPSETALGTATRSDGVDLVFWTEPSNLTAVPDEITLLWGETPIGQIDPSLEDSVPIEEKVRFIEPSEILDSLPVATSSHVLLAAKRERWWYVLAALLISFGGLVFASTPGLEMPSSVLNWSLGAIMILAGLTVAFILAGIPYEQVWLDRDRGQVLVVGGRTRNPVSRLAEAPGRSLDGFHHVRLYQRWQLGLGVDERDQEVWFVTLEGAIPHASEDGLVHLHDGAMPIGRYSSEFTARKIAAVVGFHTGLKILDTGHDQTA